MKKKEGIQCLGLEKGKTTRCHLHAKDGNKYCERNHKYMETYTDEMASSVKQCTGCKRNIFTGHFNNNGKTCNDCVERSRKNREKDRIKNADQKKKCNHEGCNNSLKSETSMFCGIHALDQFVYDTEKLGKKVCANYIRTCRKQLDKDYPKTKCEDCLQKDRINDKKNRDKQKEEAIKKNTITHKFCINCNLSIEIKYFESDRGETVHCKTCRDTKKDYDRTRVRNDTTTNEHIIKEIKRSAERRDINYGLKDELALKLISSPCHYCNKYYSHNNIYGEQYNKMGIDRVDNNKGYFDTNVVTACYTCNRMKHVSKYDDFLRYCYNIFQNFGSTNDRKDNNGISKITFAQHNCECIKRNIQTTLTTKDIKRITSKKCYYCNSNNRTDQIGIDRVDSMMGYTEKNTLVACCSICNNMKVDTNIDVFYNNILEILLNKKKINQETYDKNYKTIKKQSQIKWVNECISKIYEYDGKENKDRRNIHNFPFPSQYYINKIWKGFDIKRFSPELEFCESKEQIDTWMFFRMIVSSHYPTKYVAFNKLILIRDKFTKKYVALTSLCHVRPGWSNNSTVGKLLRNDNVYNISTCVSIPPFSFNFNGGKLATMLMFSKEVYDYMYSKNIIIAGLMTYSLHGESIQYSDIDNFNFIGYTQKNCSGKDNTKVPTKVYATMLNIMHKKKYQLRKTRNDNIKENKQKKYV